MFRTSVAYLDVCAFKQPFWSRHFATKLRFDPREVDKSQKIPRPSSRGRTKTIRRDVAGENSSRIEPKYKARFVKSQNKDSPQAGPSIRLLQPHVLSERLKKLCDGGKIADAIAMLKNAPLDAQNTPVWNTLIWECMKAGSYNLSYELFIDMKRRGFSPSTRTFQTMFSGLSRIENWPSHPKQLAHAHALYDYFQRHVEAVKKHDPNSPELTTTPIASYIKILGNAGEYQLIFDIYYALDQEGPLSANQFIFTAIFQALSERKTPGRIVDQTVQLQNASDARLLWRQMLKASERSPGFSVDSHIISAAIIALSNGRQADQAFALQIVSDYLGLTTPDLPPHSGKMPLTVQTLAAALTLCNRMRDHRLCIYFLKQVQKRSEKSGGVALLDRRHMEEVFKAFASLAHPDSPIEPKQALETLEWMLKQEIAGPNGPKIRPAISTYSSVLMACCRGVDWACATRTFELMTGYYTRDFGDDRSSAEPPRMEKRTKGRNLIPDAEIMTHMVRTALATRKPAYIRQVLRIVNHVGVDDLLGINLTSKGGSHVSQKATKNPTFYQAKLAAALVETINAVAPSHKASGEGRRLEESQCWIVMKERAGSVLRRVSREPRTPRASDTEDLSEYDRHKKTPHIVATI